MVMDLVSEVTSWVEEHWDPELTLGEWWGRLGTCGWAAPTWPEAWFGKGCSNAEAAQVQQCLARLGVVGPPGGFGMVLAGPTILVHGSEDQKARFLPDIVTGRIAWCQLFSEPAAGSDLAGIRASAVLDGDEWVVNGQKVWTSGAHVADFGMLIARTDADVPKHKGITWFVLDMHQPGVEVRPLRELTGRALFNEVFLTDVRIPASDVVGGVGNGWAVANTTLAHERAGLGAGSGGAEGGAQPGTIAGHLDRRAGEVVRRAGRRSSSSLTVKVEPLLDAARRAGRSTDPEVRQRAARLHTEAELGRFLAVRQKALRSSGGEVPGMANLAKLRMSEMFRQARELGFAVLGAKGMLHAYEGRSDASDAEVADRRLTELALWSPAPAIYGGTDQVQRNILAERVLGLPREPGDDRNVPFRALPKQG